LCEHPDAEVAYVGPPLEETLAGLDRVTMLVARPFGVTDKIQAALGGTASSAIGLYREIPARARVGFDVVFCETTKVGFAIAEFAGKATTVCCVHNVELDFMNRGARGFSRLAARNVRRSEATSVGLSDRLLVMHGHDLTRLQGIYAEADIRKRVLLHPVCAFEGRPPLAYGARKKRIVVPGSLDQRYNEVGILAFLAECWPSLQALGVELVVAGRNPRPILKRAVLAAGAVLVENPPSMEEIIRDARLVLVPDVGGAGMKLRVAEALSLGVPVVGTREGLFGYEEANEFGRVVPSIATMADAVREIITDPGLGERLAVMARRIWAQQYSYTAFSARVRAWMDELEPGLGGRGPKLSQR